jgi:hypothetical protein
MSVEYSSYRINKGEQAVPSIPIGKLNNHEIRISKLELGSGSFPPLSQAQINALTPTNGQTAYNTDTDSPQIYIAGSWYSLQVA